jgi:hypothetical protein
VVDVLAVDVLAARVVTLLASGCRTGAQGNSLPINFDE